MTRSNLDGLSGIVSSPHMLDAIILLVIGEMTGLIGYRILRQRGMHARELVAFLGAGLSLLIAMRVTATGGSIVLFGLAMLASLGLHAWHVVQRWHD